jgi:hypothetical protein
MLLGLVLGLRVWRVNQAKNEIERFLRPGPVLVLNACRNMMGERETLKSIKGAYVRNGGVVLGRESVLQDNRVPSAIKEIQPSSVFITSNYVQICGAMPRVSLLAFREGEIGEGSEMVTNGLWICAPR